MPRFIGKLSLAAAFMGGSLAWAQETAKTAAPAKGDNVLSLVKDGQPGRRCKVIRSYKHPSGGTAYEVKAEDTGEIMTVIENGNGEVIKSMAADSNAKAMKSPTTVAATSADVKSSTDAAGSKSFLGGLFGSKPKPTVSFTPVTTTAMKSGTPAIAVEKITGSDPLMSPKDFTGNSKVVNQLSGGSKVSSEPMASKIMGTTVSPVVPSTGNMAQFSTSGMTNSTSESGSPLRRIFKREAKPVEMLPSSGSMAMPMVPVAPVVPSVNAMPRPRVHEIPAVMSSDPVVRLVGQLNDELLPSLREVAAGQLGVQGQGREIACTALCQAAQNDPAASVRAASIRALGTLKAKTPEAMAVVQTAVRGDSEDSVRQAAMSVLASW